MSDIPFDRGDITLQRVPDEPFSNFNALEKNEGKEFVGVGHIALLMSLLCSLQMS